MDNLSDKDISLESEATAGEYKSNNFSVGIISLIIGIIFTIGGGLAFYFTRPCAVGECSLIPEAQESVDNSLLSINEDMSKIELEELQLNLIAVNLRLGNIPSWSKSYDQAQTLIIENQLIIDDLETILQSLQLRENAQNMSAELPLSMDEWTRVENFWIEAIALIESINNPFLTPWIENKLEEYNDNLVVAKDSFEQEQMGDQLLSEVKQIAQQNEELNNNISSLEELKIVESNWQKAIEKVREIPLLTTAETEKENLLEEYNQYLTQIRATIRQEEIANNLYGQIQNKIIQAQNAQTNNQWTNAVNYWQEINNLISQFPEDTLKQPQLESLKQSAPENLSQAQEELKQAINRNNAREELAKICEGSGKICDYSVETNRIKVTLTSDYLRNIARIAEQSTNGVNNETDVLINHINQVEKNYRYLSSKYEMPLEVYNPQQKLIVRYD
ncbi:hypothetical protein AA637_09985 [Cyanobacterium sp. HL-69]|uniref:hypothetical protein n=1 Tax=Cyanobacterium sp. HL-69 TaxID=2054282 RepID=UPI000CA34896|nr:hypothetical protein AA637_09985 [Cyanobacterium sp. HL-69]